MRPALTSITLLLVSLGFAVFFAELVVRAIDGYKLTSLTIEPKNVSRFNRAQGDWAIDFLEGVTRNRSIDAEWFFSMPNPVDRAASGKTLDERHRKYGRNGTYVFNIELVRDRFCGRSNFSMEYGKKPFPEDPYVFYPDLSRDRVQNRQIRYRYLLNQTYPSGLVTNNFGWRGRNLALNKPPNSIRLAFVGASTTVSFHGLPFGYPELVGHWLNKWSRERGLLVEFDVINAGREGDKSHQIAAIVRDEVLPMNPDFVIYYEGSNQFVPDRYYDTNSDIEGPNFAYVDEGFEESRLAIVRRFKTLVDRLRGVGNEPRKPPATDRWPNHLSEEAPDLRYKEDFPVNLGRIIDDLDYIKRLTKRHGARFVVSSFVWLVYDGMHLSMPRHREVYRYLNKTFFPYTYRHLRRYADFQNRVLRTYAEREGLPFIDVDGYFPMDPDLFIDAIHMNDRGVTVRAWIVFQELARIMEEEITSGRLPKAAPDVLTAHPSIREVPLKADKASLLLECEGEPLG